LLTAGLTLWAWPQMENKLSGTLAELAVANSFAVGNDLVFLPDFEKSFNDLFQQKVYTPGEIAYCEQFDNAMLRYASTWAVKEAVYKAVKQVDNSTLGWKKIEITREKPGGTPRAFLHGHPTDFIISLTVSHDGDYVWAVAFLTIAHNS
jgi:holo-[acyl-carrier protein] synthase